jgi:hypothetical protein
VIVSKVSERERWEWSRYLFIEPDLAIEMFPCEATKVLNLLCVVGVDLGHGGVQHRLASRCKVLFGLSMNSSIYQYCVKEHVQGKGRLTAPGRPSLLYRDSVERCVSTTACRTSDHVHTTKSDQYALRIGLMDERPLSVPRV